MRVLSFGAGVQSTALLVAAKKGLIAPVDLVVFADTHAEPASVYEWISFVSSELKTEIKFVTSGDIVSDSLSGNRFASPPFFIRNQSGKVGMLRRQCTSDYKIQPIHKFLREYKTREPIVLLMGISTDEIQRAKESRVKWIRHEFPLLWSELQSHCGGLLGWNRQQCVEFVEKSLGRSPPKSACYFCPYHTDKEWMNLKQNEPQTFERAVDFDLAIRKMTGINGDAFLHRSLTPLSEINFDKRTTEPNQLSLLDECDGMCGV